LRRWRGRRLRADLTRHVVECEDFTEEAMERTCPTILSELHLDEPSGPHAVDGSVDDDGLRRVPVVGADDLLERRES
jgi:hypothetical protein